MKQNKIVNGLWVGRELSNLELLTINSFIEHGHEFHLWTYEPIQTKLPEGTIVENANDIVPGTQVFRYKNGSKEEWGKGSLAGFSDLFRYKLLFEKGGWWCDMDVTCLRPLNFKEPYVFRTHFKLPAVGSLIKCPPRSQLMRICVERSWREVDEHNTDWHKPILILTDSIEKLGLQKFIRTGLSNEDIWADVEPHVNKLTPIPSEYHVFHWCNENWRFRGMDKNRFQADSTYGKLLYRYGVVDSERGNSE